MLHQTAATSRCAPSHVWLLCWGARRDATRPSLGASPDQLDAPIDTHGARPRARRVGSRPNFGAHVETTVPRAAVAV